MKLKLAATALFLTMLSACQKEPADLMFVNGPVITMEADVPRAGAVVVRAEQIVFVGDAAEAESRFEAGRTIDLTGRTLIPGLIDGHAHIFGLGKALGEVDLVGTVSYEEVIELVGKKAAETPAGQWITGRGWDQNDWGSREFPDHGPLSDVAPDHPVCLSRIDGHAVLANRKAMKIAGISRATKDPAGGKILRDAAGNPTGVFIDNAELLITGKIPIRSKEQLKIDLAKAVKACHEVGLTGVHDAGVGASQLKAASELAAERKLNFRLYAMISGSVPDLVDRFLENGPQIASYDSMITVRSIKLYADGALGSRGARLLEPYADDKDNRGLVITTKEEIAKLTQKAVPAGFQVCVHAIGDGANRFVLDAFEEVIGKIPEARDARLRIEHVQVLHPDDIPRFSQLGVLAAMQPTHCTSDMYWAADRLGKQRSRSAYAWKTLKNNGTQLVFGSDFPVESINPMLGIYAAVTRQDNEGFPDGGWHPSEKLDLMEAIRGFTIDAAYGAFQENLTGSLKAGKLADLVVLSADIEKTPASELPNVKADLTVVGGKVVYERQN